MSTLTHPPLLLSLFTSHNLPTGMVCSVPMPAQSSQGNCCVLIHHVKPNMHAWLSASVLNMFIRYTHMLCRCGVLQRMKLACLLISQQRWGNTLVCVCEWHLMKDRFVCNGLSGPIICNIRLPSF